MPPVSAKLRLRPRVRLRDLAANLGVSPATISNAYHHPERLSAELRARVLETAERLGYHANPTARGLRMRTTGTVAVVYTDALQWAFIDPPFSEFLQGVAEVTQQARQRLLLVGAADPGQELEAVRNVAVDGFVFYAPPRGDERIAEVVRRQLPAALVDSVPVRGLPMVTIDDEGGATALADHLLRLGHRRLGLICLPLRLGDQAGTATLEDGLGGAFLATAGRFAGYQAAARRHGLELGELARLRTTSVNTVEQGRVAAHALLSASPAPTALVCLSDQLALGALAAARERRLDVPGDVSVVGFDDIPEAARTSPPLTTVHQPHVDKGRVATRLLLDQLAGRRAASRVLPTRLVVRGSAGPARDGGRTGRGSGRRSTV
jgi:DNA-binding LacI/PurR family transcriptional regulator